MPSWSFKNRYVAEEAAKTVAMNRQFPPLGSLQKEITRYRKMGGRYPFEANDKS
jgi:hypothetical protein